MSRRHLPRLRATAAPSGNRHPPFREITNRRVQKEELT